MTAQPKNEAKCHAYGGTITYFGVTQDVYCVLPQLHKGKHRAAPMGRLHSWEGTFKRAQAPKLRVANRTNITKCPNGHATLSLADWCYQCETDRIRERYETDEFKKTTVVVGPAPKPKLSWWRRLLAWFTR